jgi:hypothetical protein
MKKVVNGRVYDTDMAASVTSWNEETHVAGVRVKVSVRLNRKYVLKEGVAPEDALKVSSWGGVSTGSEKVDTTRGEFFLSFETGSWGEESKRIVPVSDDEAKSIVEKRCSFDEYVRWFGDPRGLVVTPEAVRKAVETQRLHDYDEKSRVEKERDAAKARVSELEDRVRELENR